MIPLFINPTVCPAAIQQKPTGSPISLLRLKRGATVRFSVTVLGRSAASKLKIGIKAKDDYEGTLLALAISNEGTETEYGTRFEITLNMTSDELNRAMGLGSSAQAPSKLACVAEFSWMEYGETMLTDTLSTIVINDIIRSVTGVPEGDRSYPAPELVATKQWVNNLKASASEYGLVMLETDAVVEGDYTTVALSPTGALAIAPASFDKRGTVKLGAEAPITGQNVLLVGENNSGCLAVCADGLSAYDAAVRNGFSGTEQEWLSSLKGEPGSSGADGEPGKDGKIFIGAATSVNGTDNCNISWWRLSGIYNPGGELRELRLPTRGGETGAETRAPMFLTVWYEAPDGTHRHLGTSTNTQAFEPGQPYVWKFDDLELPQGRPLRFCPVADTETDWDPSFLLGVRTFARSHEDTVSTVQGAASLALTVACTLYVSVYNMDSFVRRQEIVELLARQAELLAMLPSATGEEGEDE